MRKKFLIPAFIILPLILFFTCTSLQNYQGSYFTNSQYDPSYVYLISSLNLSQFSGYGVEHIDHPGTPVQVIGAFAIKLCYSFNGQDDNMVRDVLINPEKYLREINYAFLIINCFGLFILGIVSYKVYSNVTLSLLLQLTPFTTVSILSLLTLVRPENFMVFVVCIFLSALILFVNLQKLNTKKYLLYVILLGIISGLGISTKITFFPLILIPLILFRGIKYKLLFLLLIFVSFLFFVFPALSSENSNYFLNWVYSLFIHNKKYGRGEPTVIDTYSFFRNIKKILFKEWFFDLAYFSVCLSMVICILMKFKNLLPKINSIFPNVINDSKFRLILGIFLAMSFQIMIVAKHYGDNYMFPVLTISVFSIFLSVSTLPDIFGKTFTKRKMNIIYLMLIFLISVYGITSFHIYSNQLKIQTEESYKLIDYMEKNLNNSIIVSSHHVSSREFALMAGISYAVSREKDYKLILNPRYPSSVFYSGEKFVSFSDDSLKIENTFKSADKIIFLCPDETYREQFLESLRKEYGISNTASEKIFSNKNGEMVYEIKLKQ